VDDQIRQQYSIRLSEGENDDIILTELTEDDYAFGLEVEFPPGGSGQCYMTGDSTRTAGDSNRKYSMKKGYSPGIAISMS
jgi:hypothetical protein